MKMFSRGIIFVGLVLLALTVVQAKQAGFSLNTGVGLSFIPSTVFPVGGTATAVIAIQGGCEQGGAGRVTITGTGGPVGVTVPSATANLPGGGTMSVPMPSQPGTYTYTAQVSMHQSANLDDHSTHTDVPSNSVTLTVYTVTDISVSGATAVTGASPETCVVGYDPCTDPNATDDYVVLTAVTDPVVSQSDVTIGWSGGEAMSPADSLRRRVKRNQAALTDVSISGPGSISVPVHRIAVVKVNLGISGVSDSEEDTVAATIFPNTDDDNNSVSPNATPPFDGSDLKETPVTGEDDLISISLSVEPAGVLGTVQLDMRGAGKLAVYRNSDKSGNLPVDLKWNLASETLNNLPLYIEGCDVSADIADQQIQLTYDWGVSLNDTVKATVCTRTGSSSASIAIHNVLKQGGVENIDTATSGTIGGRKYLVLSLSIGAGEKLTSSGNATVEVREDTTLHDTTDAYIEKTFDLGGTGWEQGIVTGSSIVWKPCAFYPTSTDADNKKGSMSIRLRKGEIWNTAEEPDQSDSTYPRAMSHNGSYDVSLTNVNSVVQSSLYFSHYTVADGWQNSYASDVLTLSQELKNLVITDTSVSTNATIDYIKYDPHGSADRANPQVSFSIEDADPHYYDIYVWLRPTGQGGWNYTGDYHLLKEKRQGSSFSLNFNDDLVVPGSLEPFEKGTLTFDIDIYEYQTDTATERMDWNGLKTPYCMSLSAHSIGVDEPVDISTGDDIVLRCSYTLKDVFNNDASSVSLITIDHQLEEHDFEQPEYIGTEINVPYTGENGNGIRAFTAQLDVDPDVWFSSFNDWRVIFTAVEQEECWMEYRRDHSSNRMLAENKSLKEIWDQWKNLPEAERNIYIAELPQLTKIIQNRRAATDAENKSTILYQNHDPVDTKRDAFRHTYYNILICAYNDNWPYIPDMTPQDAANWAERCTTAHEANQIISPIAIKRIGSYMDLCNNAVGRASYLTYHQQYGADANAWANWLNNPAYYQRVMTDTEYNYYNNNPNANIQVIIDRMNAACGQGKLVYLKE